MTAAAAVLGGSGLAANAGADDHVRTFTLEQDGECYPVVPLSGDEPVEKLYRWGRDIRSWSSEGTRDIQRSETSLLFLYRGPLGLSLVVVHDRGDDGTPGGRASFRIEGIPSDAEWVVKDDLYQRSTNVDQWEINGTVLEANESTVTDDIPTGNGSTLDNGTAYADGNATDGNVSNANANATVDDGTIGNATIANVTSGKVSVANVTDYDTRTDTIDWWWTEGRTDGGALRGLAVDGLALRIDPSFNDDAALAETPSEGEDANQGEITSWQLLTGDRDDPDRTELDLDEPVLLHTGTCDDGESVPIADDATATESEDSEADGGNEDEDGDAEESESDADDEAEDEAADTDESETDADNDDEADDAETDDSEEGDEDDDDEADDNDDEAEATEDTEEEET